MQTNLCKRRHALHVLAEQSLQSLSGHGDEVFRTVEEVAVVEDEIEVGDELVHSVVVWILFVVRTCRVGRDKLALNCGEVHGMRDDGGIMRDC